MKKFVLPLITLALLASPVLAQQDLPQQNNAQQDNLQPDVAQQNVAQPSAAQQDNVVEEIVARVNNAIITRAELRHNQDQTALEAKEQNLTQSELQARQENSLRDLIDQQLLVQKAAELGITADADLVKRLDDLRKEMKAGSMEELQKIAESQGVSWEEFKQNTKNGILTQKVVGSEVGARLQITREETQKFYDEHKADFTQPERVRLSEILIANDPQAPKGSALEASPELVAAAQTKAGEIYEQLKGGAKFDELARKESNGATAEQGGDLGYFKRGDLAKALEDQTFSLKTGQFTQPIQTRQGFIMLRVNDHIESGTPPFERVREQIQEQIYTKRVQPALREYLTKLRDAAYIDIKPGYTDTGASPNQSKLIYATDAGPRTKQVRGKLGVGKKKTVLVTGEEKTEKVEKADRAQPSRSTSERSTSELGTAKAEADAKEKAAQEHKDAEDAATAQAAAQASAQAAENEKLSHMSHNERAKYMARKQHQAKNDTKKQRQQELKQKQLAEKEARRKAEEPKSAENKTPEEPKAANNKKPKKPGKKPKEEATADTSQQADSSEPPKKKKISWF